MKLDIATSVAANRKIWKNISITWNALKDKLSACTVTHETYKQYIGMSRQEQSTIKDVGGFVAGYLVGGQRKPKYVQYRTALTLDLDFAPLSFWESFSMMEDCEAVIHSTHKHSNTSPRFRLVIPLSREVTADEYVAVARKFASLHNIDYFDPTTFQPERLMFWPSRSKDGDWFFRHQSGDFLDPDKILGMYRNWQDISEWAFHSATKTPDWVKTKQGRQVDPTEKKGIVGIFCRTYDIQSAINTFLDDKYTGEGDRYTYAGGSTAGGLVVYENKWAYSHHASDPCCDKLCNAFDLVRLHKYGYLDEGSTAIGKSLPSFKQMEDFAIGLHAVRATAAQEAIKEANFEDITKDSDTEWREKLEVDNSGNIKATAFNISMILNYDDKLEGRFSHNKFNNKVYAMQHLPWRMIDDVNGEPIKNVDISGLRSYLECTYNIVSSLKIDDAMALITNKNAFHPVKDYLDSLVWDGTPRISQALQQYMGADDTEYTREVLLKWMIAACARIHKPGTKFDEMLVLVGPQGCGKSTFFRLLGKSWFSDSFTTVQGKDSFEQLQGVWIMEVPELSAFKKADVDNIKHYIAKCVDSFRPAYGRCVEDFPRQTVFGGTTNREDFLTDPTGNRRFWPVKCIPRNAKKRIFSRSFVDVIDQLWAEANYRYKTGESLILSAPANDLAALIRTEHQITDNRTGMVEDYLNSMYPADWEDRDITEQRAWLANPQLCQTGTESRDRICILELWTVCFGKEREEADKFKTKDLNDIMRSLPGWEQGSGLIRFNNYGRQRYYVRVNPTERYTNENSII